MSDSNINSNVGSKLHDVFTKTAKSVASLKEDFVGNAVLAMVILVIVFALAYLFYMMNLDSRECSAMDSLYSDTDKYLHNLNFSDPDCQYPLKDYYVKTAYNCCSGGSYKNDYVDICSLKNIIKQGVRGLDFEIYSIDDQPVVATSTVDNNYIKETYNHVPFADALSVIINYAFSSGTAPNPADPIIIHLRIKSTNQKMFSNLGALFKQYDSFLLGPEYSYEYSVCNNENSACVSRNLGDIKLETMKGKIALIVDRLNTDFMDNADFYEFVNMTSNSMFMRALTYYNVKFTPDMTELQDYNKISMTICMPDAGSNPENPSGVVAREMGCQLIASRYEVFDQNLEENIAYFDSVGYAFALKPERLRYIPILIEQTQPNNPLLNFSERIHSTDYYSFKT